MQLKVLINSGGPIKNAKICWWLFKRFCLEIGRAKSESRCLYLAILCWTSYCFVLLLLDIAQRKIFFEKLQILEIVFLPEIVFFLLGYRLLLTIDKKIACFEAILFPYYFLRVFLVVSYWNPIIYHRKNHQKMILLDYFWPSRAPPSAQTPTSGLPTRYIQIFFCIRSKLRKEEKIKMQVYT